MASKNKWLNVVVTSSLTFGMSTVLPTAVAHAATSTNTTITWMLPEDTLIDAWGKAVVQEFEKLHPGVKVDLITPGSTAYGEKLLTLVAAGQTPDVFTDWGNLGVFTLTSHQLVTDLTPYLGKLASKVPSQYKSEYTYKGQLIGVPWASMPSLLAVNVDMFHKAKVALPPSNWANKSWTLNKLLADAKKMSVKGKDPNHSDYGALLTVNSVGSFSWLWGADAFNDKGGPQDTAAYKGAPITATYATSSGMEKGQQWLSDLTVKYKVSPSQGVQKALSTLGNAFLSGNVGMEGGGGWIFRQAAVSKPTFRWAVAPMAYGPAGVNTTQREDNAFYIAKSSKNPQLAWDLIQYTTFGPGGKQLATIGHDYSPLGGNASFNRFAKLIMQVPGFDMSKQAFRSVFLGGLKYDYPDPTNLISDATDFQNAFSQVMTDALDGKLSISKGLQEVQNNWQQYLQQ